MAGLPFTYDDLVANPKLGYKVLTDLYASSGAPTGSLLEKASAAAPTGYLLCDGTAVSRTTYAALFADIGTTWGAGDGSTTFNLPDLRDKFRVGAGSTYAVGASGGASTRTLTTTELPAHTHTGPSHTHTTNVKSSGAEATGYGLTSSATFADRVRVDGTGDTSAASGTGATGSAGTGASFSTLPPYRAVYVFIHI